MRDRLQQISPYARVSVIEAGLTGEANKVIESLEPYDVIIDCTASDEALSVLALGWWSIPRVFASFSVGFAAKRLFSFAVSGHDFPRERFAREVAPWLEEDVVEWAEQGEQSEGAGCWSPLFPARYDDIVTAAAVCVKELEAVVATRPREPRFRVFERQEDCDGYNGFTACPAPRPVLDAAP